MSGFINRFSDYFCFAVSGLALGVAVASLAAPEATPVAVAFSSVAMVSSFVQAAIRCNRYSFQSIACAAFSMASLGFLTASAFHCNNNMEHIMGVACAGVAFVINAVIVKCREEQPEVSEQLV